MTLPPSVSLLLVFIDDDALVSNFVFVLSFIFLLSHS
jgi:hypothetical protein